MHVLDGVEDRVHKRRDAWITSEEPILPPPEWMNETCIVSRYTRIGLETRRRFLLAPILVSVNGCKETPSAVARDYITLKHKHGPKWTASQRDRVLAEIGDMPLYCQPCKFEEGYYLDIKAAYWSTMIKTGWNVNYFPSRWVGITPPPLDFPWAYDKRARNCLVSVGRASEIPMWSPDKGMFKAKRGNPRANSQLYCLISDTLNAIAAQVIQAGAVYVFTDGCIAPDQKSAAQIAQVIRDWGYEPDIKGHGRGFVNNLGSYRVGDHKTKRTDLSTNQHDSIKAIDYWRWLQQHMGWARERAVWHDSFVSPKRPRAEEATI